MGDESEEALKKLLETEKNKKEQYKNQLAREKLEAERLIKATEEKGRQIINKLKIEKENLEKELKQVKEASVICVDGEDNRDFEMEEMIRLMTQNIQLLTRNQISEVRDKVKSRCRQTIIEFKSNNVRNFLNSVRSAVDAEENNEHKVMVIDYAKTRVGNDITISTTTYANFGDFEKSVLAQFKPAQDHLQLNQEIMLLSQGQDDLKKYAKKATELSANYSEALYASYRAKELELDPNRVLEAEALVTRHFIIGLKKDIRDFIRTDPTNLAMAISLATSAETSAHLSRLVYNQSRQDNGDKRKFNNNKFENRKAEGKPFNKNQGKNSGFRGGKPQNESKGQQKATNDKGERLCFKCGQSGHMIAQCPQEQGKNEERRDTRSFQASSSRDGERNYSSEGAKPKNGGSSSQSVVSGTMLKLRKQR